MTLRKYPRLLEQIGKPGLAEVVTCKPQRTPPSLLQGARGMALLHGTQTMAGLNSQQEGQHCPAGIAPPRPARGSQAERSQRSAYTMTNCNSQNASGHAASASVTEDGPFPRSPREISASRYPSCSSGRRGRGLGVSANQSRSQSLHGNHLLQLLQRCGVAAAA